MPAKSPGLHVTALQSIPAEDINSLRLASDGGSTALVGMTASPDGMHGLSLRALQGGALGASRPLGTLPSPFGTPFWDVAFKPQGSSTVWTMPGSAISSLGYQAQGKEEVTLTGHYPSGVFQHPRFVRGDSGPAVTATAMQPVGQALVLFRHGLESGQSEYRLLPAAGSGTVLDGLLIRRGETYLLLARYAAPGFGGAQRTDLRGEGVQSGVLRGLWLDAEDRPIGTAFNPLGDSATFEFDADISGDRIYLLATTNQGCKAAMAVALEGAWDWVRAPENVQESTRFFAPAVYARGQSAEVAMLSATETEPRKILVGKIDFDTP